VTATAVITTILLAMQGAALTFEQIRLGVADALAYLSARDIPVTASLRTLAAPEPVRATLDALRQGGLVSYSGDGREPVWLIEPDQQLAATFYRNSLVHFVLDTALCELAVLRAEEAGADPVGAFWAEIAWLRDLLKFEFYFPDREEHRRAVREEMDRHDPAWEQRLRSGPDEAESLLSTMRPLVSHVVVRPFVEAYRIVADVLATDDVVGSVGPDGSVGSDGPDGPDGPDGSVGSDGSDGSDGSVGPDGSVDDAEVIRRALGLGRQYVAQRRLRSSQSVSALLFSTALQLARNKGLLETGAEAAVRRAAFLAELRDLLRRLDRIENIAIRRYIQDAVIAPPTG
jgi:glycerol-3-phosphate O-acyltransferase